MACSCSNSCTRHLFALTSLNLGFILGIYTDRSHFQALIRSEETDSLHQDSSSVSIG